MYSVTFVGFSQNLKRFVGFWEFCIFLTAKTKKSELPRKEVRL